MSQASNRIEIEPKAPRSLLAAIVTLSLPVVVNNISRTMMGFVDFTMVSMLGTDAQAAMTPSVLLTFSIIALALGGSISVNTFASQSLGRSRPADAPRYAWQAVCLGVLFGALTAPLILLVPVVTRLFDHAPAVRLLENQYLQVALLSAGPTAVAYGLLNFFIGIHRPWLGCAATVIANVFNACANWVLIFGHFGLPAMGIRGAAIGTVMAMVVQCAVLFAIFFSPAFRREYQTHRAVRWEPAKAMDLLRVGAPTGAHFVIDISSWTFFVSVIVGSRFGTEQLAATNIIFQFMHLSFMPAVGIGVALAAMTGKAIGRGDLTLAEQQVKKATALAMGYMGFCGLIFLLFRHSLMSVMTNDAAVIAVGSSLFVFAAIFQMFDGLGIAAMNALRGAGDTFMPSVYNAACEWTILIGGGWLVGWAWPAGGARGPWMMATVYIIVVGLVLWTRFARGSWRKINIFKHSSADALPVVADAPQRPPHASSEFCEPPPAAVLKD